MGNVLDRFYTLTEEEREYRSLYLEGKSEARFLSLPSQVQESARLEEKISLSSSFFSGDPDESVILTKHPCFMPRYVHSHRFVEMAYVLSGSVEENIEGRELVAQNKELVIIMPGFYHSVWSADEKTVFLNLIVSCDFFSSLQSRFGFPMNELGYAIWESVDLDFLMEDLALQDDGRDQYSSLAKETILERIVLETMRGSRIRVSGGLGMRKEVFRIMAYLEEHSREVTLTSFADDFGLTEQYASRLIKEKTGLSFSNIVRKLRMEEAARLLSKGRLSSKEVAYAVGYSSPEHFSRTFKSWFGTTPALWKKTNSPASIPS